MLSPLNYKEVIKKIDDTILMLVWLWISSS